MTAPFLPIDEEERRRRGLPARRRGIADALADMVRSGATSVAELQGVVDLERVTPTPPPRLTYPTPVPDRTVTSRDLGVETEFTSINRGSTRTWDGPLDENTARHISVRPDVTRVSSQLPKQPTIDNAGEAAYRDPMASAEVRGELQRIARGSKLTKGDGTPYTEAERERARRLDQNLRARLDREEAKGGFGRRAASAFGFGTTNAPLQREINEARRAGHLVTEGHLDELDVRTRGGERLRTEPTLLEGVREEIPSMVGEMPWYLLGPGAAEARLLRGVGAFAERRGARSIGEAIGRIGRDEITATGALGRAGQRAARGTVQGGVVGAGLDVTRRAVEGETASEIAAALPLDVAVGSMFGGVLDPLAGGVADVARAGARSLRARFVPERPMTLDDMEIPTNINAQTPEERAAIIQRSVAAMGPAAQADANVRMEVERAMTPIAREIAARDWVEDMRFREQQDREIVEVSLREATERARAEAQAQEALPEAVEYRKAVNEAAAATVAYNEVVKKNLTPEGSGDLLTDSPAYLRLLQAKDALNVARQRYGAQSGAVAITALAASDDDLTEEEKDMVGIGGLALAGSTALVRQGARPSRTVARVLPVLDQFRAQWSDKAVSAAEWSSNIRGWGQLNDTDAARVGDALQAIDPGRTDITFEEVERAIAGITEEAEPGRAPLRSRLIDTIESLRGPAWEKPRPAADWIGKLKGSNTITKRELAIILPVLEEAQAQKRKVQRSEVLTLANRLAPEIEQVTLARRPAERVGDADEGDTDLLSDLDQFEEEFNTAVAAGGGRAADLPNEVQTQINARAARIAEIESEIERRVEVAQEETRDAEQAESRAYREAVETLEGAGIGSRAIDRATQIINEEVEGEYIPRGTMDKAFQEIIDDISPDDDAMREMFSDADYKVGIQRELVIKNADGEEVERVYLLPDETPESAEKAWLYDNASGEEIEQKAHTFEVEEDENTFIAFDKNGDKAGEGSEDIEAIREAVSNDDLDTDWRDEKYSEARQALDSYAEARSEYLRVESENYQVIEHDDSEFFRDEVQEIERLRDEEVPALQAMLTRAQEAAERHARRPLPERVMNALGITRRDERALEAGGQQTLLPAEELDTGARPPGEPIAIIEPEVRDLDPVANPYLMPIEPIVKGDPKYETYQRIGGGYDYAELVNVWVNNPGETYGGSHHTRSHAVEGNDVGHIRVETHDVRPDVPEVDAPTLPIAEGDSQRVREIKQEIVEERAARDKNLAAMAQIVREHEALPADQREGNIAVAMARRYEVLNQQAIDHGQNEQNLRFDLIGEMGLTLGDAEPVRVMVESQSDWAQEAYESGVQLTGQERDDALVRLEEKKQRAIDARVQAAGHESSVHERLTTLMREAEERVEALDSDFRASTLRKESGGTRVGGMPSAESLRDGFGFKTAEAWLQQEHPDVWRLIELTREVNAEYAKAVTASQQAYAQERSVEGELGNVRDRRGVPPSPFLDDNAAFTLNAARFLIDSAERGYERIAWSDSGNRMEHASLPMTAAVNVYDKYTPNAIKKLLGTLGFKDPKIERTYIKGAGHWSMRLTPEMRMAIRRTGLPILGLTMLVGSAEEAQAQETTAAAPKGEGNALKYLLSGGVGATIATGALVFLARRRAARLAVQNNPLLKAALSKAIAAMPEDQLARARRPEFAFQRAEPRGTEYEAPIDVAETPTGKGPAQFNVAKIGLSTEGEAVFRDVVEKLALKKRYVSWDETNAEAAQRTTTIDDLLHVKPWSGTDALAARMFQSQTSERLSDLSKRMGTATKEEKIAITAEMDRLSSDLADISKRAAGEREAAGRTLNAYKIIAKHNMDEGTWQTLAQKAKGEIPLTTDEILRVRGHVARRDREALTSFISGLHKSSNIEKWLTFWKAGLLTGLTTHVINPLSNAVEAATLAAREPVAVAVDAIIALAHGTEREKALPRGFIASRLKGFKKGLAEGKQILKTGVRPEEIGRWDVRQTNYDNPILQKYTQFVFRMLAAEDRPFYNMALEAALDELSTIEARRAVRIDPSLTFDQVHAAIRANPPNDLASRAAEEATRAVFQNKGTLARIASGAQAPLRKGGKGRAAARLAVETTLPFTQTPSNIASRFVDTTPLGLVSAVLRQLGGDFDQRRFSEDIARALVGTGGYMLLGYWLAENDMLTGSAPTEPGRRDVWRSMGKQAHSVKLGGRWYNVARLGPTGMTMAMGAQLHAMAHENPDDMVKIVGGMAGSVGRVMLDQSFLQGVSRSLETVADPTRYAGSQVASTAGSVVPAIVGRAAQASDPLRREAPTPSERIQSRIPIASRRLRPALNVFGEEMKRSVGDRVAAMTDPLFSTRAEDEPLLTEIDRLGLSVPPVRKTRDLTDPRTGDRFTVRYTDAERHEALRRIGPRRREFVGRVVNSERYGNMPDREKEKAIRRAIEDADDEFYARDEQRRIRERINANRSRP